MSETTTPERAVERALGLFASAIRSGEDWTPTCQEARDAARHELRQLREDAKLGAALRAAIRESPPPHPLWTPYLDVGKDGSVRMCAPTGKAENDATRALAASLRSSPPKGPIDD